MSDPFGTKFTVHIPASAYNSSKAVSELTPKMAERIAVGLSEVLRESDVRAGRPPRPRLHTDWVEITGQPEAGTYSVTVVDRDVMKQVREFRDTPGWASFHDPMMAGHRLEGIKHYLSLRQHGQLIGMSTSGKSSLIQCGIAHATRCRDVVVWIGGVQKLYDLVAGWVEPLLGTGRVCPIDWIANGFEDTLKMMATAMKVARYRQGIRMSQRGNWPAIFLILDEVSFLLEPHGEVVKFDNVPMHADVLAADIVRGATSGDVFAQLATQHDVHSVFGDKGGTLQAQLKYTGMFKIRDNDALGRQLQDYHLKMPTHAGEYWLDDGEGLPFRLKADYIQTIDPSKKRLHDGLTIADIALARSELRLHHNAGLDDRSAREAGEAYQNRHTVVDDAFLDYLTNSSVPSIATPAQITAPVVSADPFQRELDEARQEMIQAVKDLHAQGAEIPQDIVDTLGGDLAAIVGEMDAPSAPVTTLAGRQSRKERVKAIIRENGPLARAGILAKLAEGGDQAGSQVVTNILTELAASGEYKRDDDGQYWAL